MHCTKIQHANKLGLLALAFVLGSVSCIDAPSGQVSSATPPGSTAYSIELIAGTPSDLPTCTSAITGTTAYVASPSSLWFCNMSRWIEITCRTAAAGTLAYASDSGTLYACISSEWTLVTLPEGPRGPAGPGTLVTTTAEPAGSNCASGGQRIDLGQDADGSGVLDASEVTSTSYLCNGAQGPEGPAGSDGAPGSNGSSPLVVTNAEPAGANCEAGGVRIDTGLDTDGDGVLDPSEVTRTSYVCNASAGEGSAPAIKTTAISAGMNCVAGGYRLDVGADSDGNGVLDASEVTSTSYVCNNNYFDAISAGDLHTCAVLVDGTARCWGYSEHGELGDGSGASSATPVTVSSGVALPSAWADSALNHVAAISAGAGHSCALLTDGTVRCWGSNGDGELGDGSTTDSSTPVAVSGLTDAVAISAGISYTCAVLADGTARCWGSNRQGQLGNGSTTSSSMPVAVSALSGAVEISASVAGGFTCALLGDGTARCWGNNSSGELGDGSTVSSLTPLAVSDLTSAVAISTGFLHACATLSDGTVRCWGFNGHGQLGDGSTVSSSIPVAVSGLTRAKTISAGSDYACAVLDDLSARCWGSGANGQLGDGNNEEVVSSPVPVMLGL